MHFYAQLSETESTKLIHNNFVLSNKVSHAFSLNEREYFLGGIMIVINSVFISTFTRSSDHLSSDTQLYELALVSRAVSY